MPMYYLKWDLRQFKRMLIIILPVCIIIFVLLFSLIHQIKIYNSDRSDADRLTAIAIEDGLTKYIKERNSLKLGFDKKNIENMDVQQIIEEMKKEIIIGNKTYGPYIDPRFDYDLQSKENKGWEFIIYRKKLYANVYPSRKGNSIIFKD